MANKPKKTKKRKGKIRIRTGAKIVKKDSVQRDSVSPIKTTLSDNGTTFKVKIKRKR